MDIIGKEFKGNRGTYVLEKLLARGARSNVYQAIWVEQQEFVCIKMLTFQMDEEDRRRIYREEKTISQLNHPNIVRIIDSTSMEGFYCTVMELAPDGSLADKIKPSESMPISQVVPIIIQVASALQYVHISGIVHRDIKPGNILINKDRYILSDFGIARALGAQIQTTAGFGGNVGTPLYMSPEQGSGQSAKPATDQYSLAAIAFELLTGRPPYQGDTPLSTIYMKIHDPLPKLRDINPTISPSVEAVVLKGLDQNPSKRYNSVIEFANALNVASYQLDTPQTSQSLPFDSNRIPKITLFVIFLAACIGSFIGTLVASSVVAILWATFS